MINRDAADMTAARTLRTRHRGPRIRSRYSPADNCACTSPLRWSRSRASRRRSSTRHGPVRGGRGAAQRSASRTASSRTRSAEIVGDDPAIRRSPSRSRRSRKSNSNCPSSAARAAPARSSADAHHARAIARVAAASKSTVLPRRDPAPPELFGHEKGVHGRSARRRGCFEMAEGGTLFPRRDRRHLRARRSRCFASCRRRPSSASAGTQPIRANVRVVCATHRDLRDGRAASSARTYYRLRGITLEVPALRAPRRPKIAGPPPRSHRGRAQRIRRSRSSDAIDLLQRHRWPGQHPRARERLRGVAFRRRTITDRPDENGRPPRRGPAGPRASAGLPAPRVPSAAGLRLRRSPCRRRPKTSGGDDEEGDGLSRRTKPTRPLWPTRKASGPCRPAIIKRQIEATASRALDGDEGEHRHESRGASRMKRPRLSQLGNTVRSRLPPPRGTRESHQHPRLPPARRSRSCSWSVSPSRVPPARRRRPDERAVLADQRDTEIGQHAAGDPAEPDPWSPPRDVTEHASPVKS